MKKTILSDFQKSLLNPKVDLEVIGVRRQKQPEGWKGTFDQLNSHLIIFVEFGAIDGLANARGFHLDTGDAIWLPPGTTRQIWNAKDIKNATTFRLRFKLSTNTPSSVQIPLTIKSNAWPLSNYLTLLNDLWRSRPTGWQDEFRTLLVGFSIRFHNLSSQTKEKERTLSLSQRERVMTLATNQIFHLTPANLATALGYNTDYFGRLFRSSYGKSPKTFLKEERLRQASQMILDEKLTIKEICWKLGEKNISKFHRQFKDLFGVTPSAYRKSNSS